MNTTTAADMIVAGTVTSLALLDWCMVELTRNPIVMEKVQSEVRGIAHGEEKSGRSTWAN
ncbi:hypothetical protein IEQ34_002875 [Dendrobium chrysotoxum]|uniref:Cytochrome P450 n=1 Tax=Dendrobium chrysotoxum TaxID=161865 RepID=A0AAV7HHS5_DENCH|nr:hypothetical protein IEQ34_002875 [Dendrobium chrysotoxum]